MRPVTELGIVLGRVAQLIGNRKQVGNRCRATGEPRASRSARVLAMTACGLSLGVGSRRSRRSRASVDAGTVPFGDWRKGGEQWEPLAHINC